MEVPESSGRLRAQRILMADGEASCAVLEELLVNRGFVTTCRNDGVTALQAFQQGFYDLVLTDLDLPSLDGMRLLSAIKEVNPRVPVIIISGRGDADTVVSCLKSGAENFLTKPVQEEVLIKVVNQALAISRTRLGKHVFEGRARQSTSLQSPSRPEVIKEIIFLITQSALAINYIETDLDNNIKLALVEAITNAMEHGHKWDEDKLVDIYVDIDYHQLKVVVQDQGEGFDLKALSDPTDLENLISERGRGIFLIQAIMDEVIFNERGNCITMISKRREEGEDKP
jgi:FixJ family two-component response regulator